MSLNADEPMIAGICLEIAKKLNIEPIWVRIGAVAIAVASGGTIVIVYLLLALIMLFSSPDDWDDE